MHRVAALVVCCTMFCLSLAGLVLPVSAASTTCYRVTATFSNTNSERDIVSYAEWRLYNQSSQLVDTLFEEEVFVRYGQPKTITYQEEFDSSLNVTFVFDHAVYFTDGQPADSDAGFSATVTPCTGALNTQATIADGRINATDLAAPAAIYCASGDGLDIWDIDGAGHGTFGIHVTQADIDAGLASAKTNIQNVLIAQWGDKSLYAIYNGQLLLLGHDLKEPWKLYQALLNGNICA